MKQLISIILVFFPFYLFAQKKVLHSIEALHIAYTQLKANRDTFIVNGTYHSSGKVNKREVMNRLHKKGLIKKNDYKTALSFSLFETSPKYYLPYMDKDDNPKLLDESSVGKKISLEIVIFKSVKKDKGDWFFVIHAIKFLE
jgi:hypothetical protein